MSDPGGLSAGDASLQLELLAAALRADDGDSAAFVAALGAKLGGALPGRVEIRRRRRLLGGQGAIEQIRLAAGDDEEFVLDYDGTRVTCARSKVVRGITLSRDRLELDAWVDEVVAAIAAEAQRTEAGRLALERILGT